MVEKLTALGFDESEAMMLILELNSLAHNPNFMPESRKLFINAQMDVLALIRLSLSKGLEVLQTAYFEVQPTSIKPKKTGRKPRSSKGQQITPVQPAISAPAADPGGLRPGNDYRVTLSPEFSPEFKRALELVKAINKGTLSESKNGTVYEIPANWSGVHPVEEFVPPYKAENENLAKVAEDTVTANLLSLGRRFDATDISQYEYKADGQVIESSKLPKPVNRIQAPSTWNLELRQDIPAGEHAVHDYYASYGMRRWRCIEDEQVSVVYWSPNPSDWADTHDNPVAPPSPLASFVSVAAAENDDPNGPPLNCVHCVWLIPEEYAISGDYASWSNKTNMLRRKKTKKATAPEGPPSPFQHSLAILNANGLG